MVKRFGWNTALSIFIIWLLLVVGLVGCTGETGATGPVGPQGLQGPQGDPGEDATVACSACHDAIGTVNAKQIQWAQSGHGEGVAWEYAGGRVNCTSCHSGTGFVAWTAVGGPTNSTVADANNTPIDCRACHNVHTTYTGADWAFTTVAPVEMIIDASSTYDVGNSNLCATCHQSRTASGGTSITSTHYGAHHGPQANMMLGIGGYGITGDTRSSHYTQVEDGCITCHMSADTAYNLGGHNFTPSLIVCQSCHPGLDTFDRRDTQTLVKELLAELEELLDDIGAMHDGHPVVGDWGDDITGAVYNYMFVLEDGSFGVHNGWYAIELLEKSISDLN